MIFKVGRKIACKCQYILVFYMRNALKAQKGRTTKEIMKALHGFERFGILHGILRKGLE